MTPFGLKTNRKKYYRVKNDLSLELQMRNEAQRDKKKFCYRII